MADEAAVLAEATTNGKRAPCSVHLSICYSPTYGVPVLWLEAHATCASSFSASFLLLVQARSESDSFNLLEDSRRAALARRAAVVDHLSRDRPGPRRTPKRAVPLASGPPCDGSAELVPAPVRDRGHGGRGAAFGCGRRERGRGRARARRAVARELARRSGWSCRLARIDSLRASAHSSRAIRLTDATDRAQSRACLRVGVLLSAFVANATRQ